MDSVKIMFAFYPLYVKWNHGIALLSALCKERDIETFLYILDAIERFKTALKHFPGQFVSFSCVTVHDYKDALPFMQIAKEEGKTVLLGGVYPRRGTPLDAPVDYICRGEGEDLPDFLLNGNDRCFKKPLLCGDLNILPLPNYEMFRHIPYKRSIPFLEGKKVLPYVSSRGCPHKCSFCEVANQPKFVRIRTKVEEDLTFLRDNYTPDIFQFGDELLPYYSEKWRDSWGNFHYPFAAYIRADISEECLDWLIDRGMIGCAFGVENGDEVFRNQTLGKNLTDEAIYRTVKHLKRRGVEYAPFYIVGTPGETWALTAKTHRMARELGGYPYFWQYENLFEGVK